MSDRVRTLLGDPSLSTLIDKLDRRLAKRPEITGFVTLTDASEQTREAIMSLLGKPPRPTGPLRIGLLELEQAIRSGGLAAGLIDAITQLRGRPPRHAGIERRRRTDAWASLPKKQLEHLAPSAPLQRGEMGGSGFGTDINPQQLDFINRICRDGTLRRAARDSLDEGHRLLTDLVRCMTALPLAIPTPLPIFAAAVLGDSHGLDAGQPLTPLVLRAIAQTAIAQTLPHDDDDTPQHPRGWWNRVNVVADELSSTVLVLNLRASGSGLLDRTLAAHAAVGEPCRITFRQLRLHAPTFEDTNVCTGNDNRVFICENPSVLAAAAESLGVDCRPLICIEGQPSHAACTLIHSISVGGAHLYYHGDIDRAGLQITQHMLARFGARPWRMTADDYDRHVLDHSPAFAGEIPATPWNLELAIQIERHQKILYEESMIATLLGDLRHSITPGT